MISIPDFSAPAEPLPTLNAGIDFKKITDKHPKKFAGFEIIESPILPNDMAVCVQEQPGYKKQITIFKWKDDHIEYYTRELNFQPDFRFEQLPEDNSEFFRWKRFFSYNITSVIQPPHLTVES